MIATRAKQIPILDAGPSDAPVKRRANNHFKTLEAERPMGDGV